VLALTPTQALYAIVNNKHRKTLKAIFVDPVSPTIAWASIEGLLIALGCKVVEGGGSRVRFEKDGKVATFHRPHPEPTAKRYQVKDARDYLRRLGVER
jgi:HicA toxin of bacterial toxin-antitoxin,